MGGSLTVEPTTREHTREIAPIEPFKEGWKNLDRDGMEGWLATYARTFRVRATGRPVAIVGITVLFPGVGEAWACIDAEARPFIFSLVRELRKLKEFAFETLALWRIHAPIQEGFLPGHRFAELMGLKPEARLESWFHPQEAAIMYREVRS